MLLHRLTLLLVAAGLLVPSSGVAAGWLAPTSTTPDADSVFQTTLSAAPDGTRFAAWNYGKANQYGVAIAMAPPGGGLGPAQTFPDGSAYAVASAAAADGTAVVAWDSDASIRVAVRGPGAASFTEVSPISVVGLASPPVIAMHGDDVYIAYVDRCCGKGSVSVTEVHVARLSAGATAFVPVGGADVFGGIATASYNTQSGPKDALQEPSLAIDDGTLHLTWEEFTGTSGVASRVVLHHASAAVDGNFGTPDDLASVDLGQSTTCCIESSVLARDGHAYAVWTTSDFRAVAQELGGSSGPVTLSSGDVYDLHASVDADGTLVAVWDGDQLTDFSEGVFAASLPAGGTPSPTQRLTPAGANRQILGFADDATGAVAVLAAPPETSQHTIIDEEAAVRPSGGTFGPVEDVSRPRDLNGDPADRGVAAIALAAGRASASWLATDDAGATALFLSDRDADPPTFGAVAVPSSAAPGATLGLAAQAADTQSPATVAWDFGDGAQASGASVAHAYGAAGVYTVTITATDGAGNQTSTARTLTIAAPSPAGGPGPTTTPPDRRAPVLSRLRASHSRFRVGAASVAQISTRAATTASKKRSTPTGTTFSLNVDERATLVLQLSGSAAGRRSRTGCVAGGKTGARCTLRRTGPTLIRTARGPGAVSIPFTGRSAGTRLATGSYTARVTAIDAAGNRSRPATVRVTVVSR